MYANISHLTKIHSILGVATVESLFIESTDVSLEMKYRQFSKRV